MSPEPSPGETTPTLSAFPHRGWCSILPIILWPSSGLTPTGPCLSCTENSRAGCSTPGGSHQSRVERQNHLPRPAGHASFYAAQDTVVFLGCESTLPAHVQPYQYYSHPFISMHFHLTNIIPDCLRPMEVAWIYH